MAKTLPPTTPPSSWRYSKRSAEKHRYFSREFVISEAEKPEFRRLERDLLNQLAPQTALQHVAADQVVCCCWRCRRAAQAEARFYSRLIAEPELPQPQQTTNDTSPSRSAWPLAKPGVIRQAVRLLDSLIQDYKQSGLFRQDVKAELAQAFGDDFVELLTKWAPRNPEAAKMAVALDAHERNFRLSSIPDLSLPEELLGTRVALDPLQGREMTLKLLEQKRNHLIEFQQYRDAASSTQATQPAEAPRYFAGAMKDLQQAVGFFYALRNAGL